MKNMKVSKKLFVAFGVVIAFMLLIVFLSCTAANTIRDIVKEFYEVTFTDVEIADDIDVNLQESAKNLLHSIVDSDLGVTNERLNMAKENLAKIEEDVTKLKENYPGDVKDIDTIIAECNKAHTYFDQFSAKAKENDVEGAYDIYKTKLLPSLTTVVASIDSIQANVEELAEKEYGEVNNRVDYTNLIIMIVGVIAIAVAFILAFVVTNMLVTGIKQVEQAAEKMALGDFSAEIKYRSRDELGMLADAMRNLSGRMGGVIYDIDQMLGAVSDGNLCVESTAEEMYVGDLSNILVSLKNLKEKLNDTMARINTASDQVAAGSDQVSGGAQVLSQGATEQASSVEELAATISVISDMINTNATSAVEASEKTNMAGAQMQEATTKMDDLVLAMNEISASSDETKKIIKNIEDIAFQTNILALNAAVEAARAGEAGKGFAVVADEVRNLASKSAEAAKNTTALIENIVTSIENGNALVGEVAEKMNEVAAAAGAVAVLNNAISDASKEAADSINQVAVGVDQISSVVQNNSATAQQSAAASEELSGQAQMLKELISDFKISE